MYFFTIFCFHLMYLGAEHLVVVVVIERYSSFLFTVVYIYIFSQFSQCVFVVGVGWLN